MDRDAHVQNSAGKEVSVLGTLDKERRGRSTTQQLSVVGDIGSTEAITICLCKKYVLIAPQLDKKNEPMSGLHNTDKTIT